MMLTVTDSIETLLKDLLDSKQKNYEAVITECSKALELNGRYTKALHRRAKAYEVRRSFLSTISR